MTRLDDIKKRLADATAGPWTTHGYPETYTEVYGPDDLPVVTWGYDGEQGGVCMPADARFIANAREDVEWLVEQVEALTAFMEWLNEWVDDEDGWCGVYALSASDVRKAMERFGVRAALTDEEEA